MRKRVGGTVTNAIIGVLIIYLAVSAAYFYIRGLESGPGPNGGASTTSSVTMATSSASATSAQGLDNMSLSQLQTLSFANSSKCDGLLDTKYWDTAIRASGNSTAHMIPNTVYGLAQSWNGWTNFFRDNMSNPPAWLSLGLGSYTSSLEAELAARVMGTNNVTLAAAIMKNYTASIGALEVTGVDTLTWGGLSAVKAYYQTGSVNQAAAQTFPAQVYRLFKLSQDCNYSELQRAEFLGTALSMTALIAITSGKDGFGPKFESLLVKLGIQDAWPAIKGSLKTINDASPPAAYETTMILAAMAKKFPANFNDAASFTASRVASMVQVLKGKGLSSDEITQKVAGLSKAVDESGDAGHVAELADAISYGQNGFIGVKIDSNLRAALYYSGSSRALTASFLASILSDFRVGEVTALKVTIHKQWAKLSSYEVYQGGSSVSFTLPDKEVHPGDDVGLSFEVLTVENFAKSIPDITLTNAAPLQWLGDIAVLKDFKVVDGTLEFEVLQSNQWSSVGSYVIEGKVLNYPGVSRQYGGIFADFVITDYAGRSTNLRIRFDGFTFNGAGLQLVNGGFSAPISMLSNDGFRLKILYRTDNQVATVYLGPPSESAYRLGVIHTYSGSYLDLLKGRYTKAYQIDNVVVVRDLEKAMLSKGGTHDLGRLGSEIAYVASDRNLGLKNVIIEEPAKGGRDLYTQDNSIAIQARLLTDFTGSSRDTVIQNALFDLANQIQKDYQNQPQMRDGYAILSYLDVDGTLKTIILEVPKW